MTVRFPVLIFLAAGAAFASPEYARRTGKDCNYCHPPANYNLNDAGQYYKAHNRSLKGYVPAKPDADSKGKPAPPTAEKQPAK